jgi:uncharacterized protein YbjT (DUF2867 family)
MARILVIGASQGIGLAVCNAAARGGHKVRAMSRRGTAASDNAKLIEPFSGDALKSDDVRRALEGIDVVVQALGVPPSLDLILRPVTLFSSATRVLLPAMETAGVRKLVCVTGFGAGDSNAAINMLQLIVASDLDWLIVRPGVLTNFAASGNYKVLTSPGTWRNGVIARADVAEFIVKRISADHFGREKPVVIRHPL